MAWVCAVQNCTNNSTNCPQSFKHDLPRSGPLRQKWMDLCGISETKKVKDVKICRDHFVETDYFIFSTSGTGSSRLKPNVIPTKNLPEKMKTQNSSTPDTFQDEDSDLSDATMEELKNAAKNSSIKVMLEKHDYVNGFVNGQKKRSIGNDTNSAEKSRASSRFGSGRTGQHATRDFVTPVKEMKMSEAKSVKLPTITQAIIMLMNNDPYTYLGISREAMDLVEIIASNLSISEVNIILTFRKLRLDEDFQVLEHYFHLSEGEAKKLFCYTVTTIAKYMQALVTLPSKYVVFEDIPVQNRQKLCQTQFYLSHFPIFIEKTTDLFINESTFDGTKHRIQFFYLVTPDGYISYISPGYGGRLPPEKILPSIAPLREIQNDGFNIVDLVSEFKENTRNPHTLQFEQQVAYEVIKKIRNFALINNKKALDKDLIKYIDEIVIIITALVNLQTVKYDEEEESVEIVETIALETKKNDK